MNPRTKAPVLFVSHGAPTFASEPGVLGPKLQDGDTVQVLDGGGVSHGMLSMESYVWGMAA